MKPTTITEDLAILMLFATIFTILVVIFAPRFHKGCYEKLGYYSTETKKIYPPCTEEYEFHRRRDSLLEYCNNGLGMRNGSKKKRRCVNYIR